MAVQGSGTALYDPTVTDTCHPTLAFTQRMDTTKSERYRKLRALGDGGGSARVHGLYQTFHSGGGTDYGGG